MSASATLDGLTGRPELNGSVVEVLGGPDPSSGRVPVRLKDGTQLKVKPANLRQAGPDQQVATRPAPEFEPSIGMFLPRLTPKRMLFLCTWLLGVLIMLYAPPPLEASPEAQDHYEHLLAKAGTMRAAIEAESELMVARRQLGDLKGITSLWRLSADSRAKVGRKQVEVDAAQKTFDKHNGERQGLVREAKRTVGLWSEYGVGEARASFWKAIEDGKAMAKRMSWWDAMFFGMGSMMGGRRDQDAHILIVILQFVGRILMNFTIGFVFSFIYFVFSLFSLVLSYEPDAFTGGLFFFVAFFAAGSMVAGIIFSMYAGTAATVGGGLYMLAKSQQARLEGQQGRRPGRLRQGRPHYD